MEESAPKPEEKNAITPANAPVINEAYNSSGLLNPPQPSSYIPISGSSDPPVKWFKRGLVLIILFAVITLLYMVYQSYVKHEPISNPFSSEDNGRIEYVSYKVQNNQPRSLSVNNKSASDSCEYTDIKLALQEPEKVCTLTLVSADLTAVPAGLDKLTNLKTLNLDDNDLSKLRPEIGDLMQTTTLILNRNKLVNLPSEISRLTNLRKLSVSYNQLKELPVEIGRLTNLEYLDIAHNPILKLPEEIKSLINLKIIEVEENQFTPEELQRIKFLLPNTRIKIRSY